MLRLKCVGLDFPTLPVEATIWYLWGKETIYSTINWAEQNTFEGKAIQRDILLPIFQRYIYIRKK